MGKLVCGRVSVAFKSVIPGAAVFGAAVDSLGLDGADIVSPIKKNSIGVKLYCIWFWISNFMMGFASILEGIRRLSAELYCNES